MKFFAGCVTAAALILAAPADARVLSQGSMRLPYTAAADLEPPYSPSELPPPPHYGDSSGYSDDEAPGLLPPMEVYAVLRENGFSPLGVPRLRGNVYTIAAIDPQGDDGRLVIDARDGRILRFMLADGMAPATDEGAMEPYRPQAAPPPILIRDGPPRPPASIPHVASHSVPLPKAAPPRGTLAAARPIAIEPAPRPAPPQQSAAMQPKPTPTILPTREMPAVQGLD
jgi:hypothetical protein